MSTRVCTVILMLCYNILADRKLVLDLASQSCPYSNFCHTDAWKTMPDNTDFGPCCHEPCCHPCTCDDDCLEFDNCCPDKDLTDVTRPNIVPCMDSYVKSRSSDPNVYVGFYRVVDTCLISEDRSNLELKCRGQNITSLEDLIWVSDKTGKIYQNIHCAKCNGIKEPITWQMQITCVDIMRATFDNLWEVLLSDKCKLINTPPEGLKRVTSKYACINPNKIIYTSCNETGLMTSYNPALQIACAQSSWPFQLRDYQFAKNIFCAMCNVEISIFDELCFFLGDRKKQHAYTFFIDYTSLQADTTAEGNTCRLDEMFDKFLGLCRKLWCPIGTAPFYGRCKQLVSKMNGFYANVQFYLDIIWNQTSLFPFHKNYTIWNMFSTKFIELADLGSNCEVCGMRIDMAENSVADFILGVTFEFNSECDYGLALAKVADMRGKLIEINITRTVILALLFQYDKQPSKVNNVGVQTLFNQYTDDCYTDYTLSFDDITCPRLELDYTEIELFSQTANKEMDIFASFFMGTEKEQNVTIVSVCLDNYISAMLSNGDPLSYDKMSVQMLLIQVCVLTVNKVYYSN